MRAKPRRKQHALTGFLHGLPREDCSAPGVGIELRPHRGYLNLRGNPGDEQFLRGVSSALGQPLPLLTNTFTGDEPTAFWLGPDEWLLATKPGRQDTLAERLLGNLRGLPHSLADVSGGMLAIRLSGGCARELLAKGCTLDLHPRAFKPGQCAQTVLAKTALLIALMDHEPTFELIVRRSFAEYAALWLHRNSREYGVHFQSVASSGANGLP
ncbi:MAG: sarcosine oxidase, gamma subunit family protein [Halieaceae bacterium]|nr:sarcosine oxidase, gamma subunit family protein [Halieaceae bacterium]